MLYQGSFHFDQKEQKQVFFFNFSVHLRMVRRMVWLPALTRSDLSDSCSTRIPGCQVFLLLRGVTVTSSPALSCGSGCADLS